MFNVMVGAMTGRLIGSTPSFVDTIVSSLLVPVMDGFHQKA